MTELLFCAGIVLVRCTTPSAVFIQPYGKMIIWDHFYCFKNKHISRGNLMHGNIDSISHVPILTWPGMTSPLPSHGSVNDTSQQFCLNLFRVLSFDTKMPHLKLRWRILRANQCYGNLPFISIDVFFSKTVPLKTFPWIFPHPKFIKKLLYLMY